MSPKLVGFAAMDPDQQREIASKGGKAVHAKGRSHEWTREEAIVAGRIGGAKSHGGGRKPKHKKHSCQ